MGNPVSESREKAARQLARSHAERAVRTLVEVAKSEKSARTRVVAAKAILRRDTNWADQKIAIESLVQVMETGKSVAARVAAAQEILRIGYGPPRVWRADAAADSAESVLSARARPPESGARRALWRDGTALASGTVALPR